MSTTTPRLRFRWTKRMNVRQEIVFVVERKRFNLMISQRGDTWVASAFRFSSTGDLRSEVSEVDLATKREAQLWAESQVPA